MDSNHRLSACKAAALAAEPRDHEAETEGIEPPTLAGSCFQDSVLDQPDSLHALNQAAAARIERALTRSKRVVRTFTLRRITFAPLPPADKLVHLPPLPKCLANRD